MVPVSLTIKGLYSYQTEQTIDFRSLTGAGLFGIFGSVGSGKSSILEAITFALYGKTDRLNLSGDNRNYNMMNLRSKELLIVFEFEAGKNNDCYQVVVKGRRNRNNFDEVKKLDRQAFRKDNNEWIPIDAQSIEEVVGLSYDNFKRTIIIPQGQFQEFLQLGDKDRTKMMKELFHLEKYELYPMTVSLENKNKADIQFLEGQLQQLGEIDMEQLNQLKREYEQLAKDYERQNKELEVLRQKFQQMEQLKQLTEQRQNLLDEQQKLEQKAEQIQQLALKIERYEKAALQFKFPLEQKQELQKDITRKTEQQKVLDSQIHGLTLSGKDLSNELEVLTPKYEKRDVLQLEIADLKLLLKIKGLDEKIKHDDARLKKGIPLVETTTEELELLIKKRDGLHIKLEQLEEKQTDVSMLVEIQNWHSERRNLIRQGKDQTVQLKGKEDELKQINQEFLKMVERDWFTEVNPPESIENGIELLNSYRKELQQKKEELQNKQQEYSIQSRLKDFAESLEEGAPCPLCGAVHHPKVYSELDQSSHLNQIARLLKECTGSEEKLAQLLIQLNDLKNRTENARKELTRLKKLNDQLTEKLKEHDNAFDWPLPECKDFDVLQKKLNEAKIIQNQLRTIQKEWNQLHEQVELKRKKLDLYKKEIEKIENEVALGKRERETLTLQLSQLTADHIQEKTEAEFSEQIVSTEQKLKALESRFKELSDLANKNKEKLAVAQNRLSVLKEELEELDVRKTKVVLQLDEALSQSVFKSLEEVVSVLAESLDLEKARGQVSDFKNRQMLVKDQLRQLNEQLQKADYKAEEHQKLIELLKVRAEQEKELLQKLSGIKEKSNRLENDLNKQADLQKKLSKIRERGDNLKIMKSLFKGSGFVNYISSVYLQNLCEAANDRFFKLTRQRLSIELSADNNFLIRDYMNGGKLRSVKTLSGGQTFQAALSLALALADNIQQITESNQNFFFLDEGFGSLDKESLQIVFDTLKSLRKEHRIVGVISHVEEMQQEIDVHLKIQNSVEQGSQIYPSWNN